MNPCYWKCHITTLSYIWWPFYVICLSYFAYQFRHGTYAQKKVRTDTTWKLLHWNWNNLWGGWKNGTAIEVGACFLGYLHSEMERRPGGGRRIHRQQRKMYAKEKLAGVKTGDRRQSGFHVKRCSQQWSDGAALSFEQGASASYEKSACP